MAQGPSQAGVADFVVDSMADRFVGCTDIPPDAPIIGTVDCREDRVPCDGYVRQLVYECCAAAGIARASPHALRHSWTTTVNRHGGDVLLLQHALGHADPKTTARYCSLSTSNVLAAVRNCPVLCVD